MSILGKIARLAIYSLCVVLPAGPGVAQSPVNSDQRTLPKFFRLDAGDLEQSVIERRVPALPPLPSNLGISTAAALQLVVDESGTVRHVKPLDVHPRLSEDAVKAARQWRFALSPEKRKPGLAIGAMTLQFAPTNSTAVLPEIVKARAAVVQKPDDPQLHYALAVLLEPARRYEEAVEELKQVLAQKPDFEEACLLLGKIYGIMQQTDDQISVYRRFLSSVPKAAEVMTPLARALMVRARYSDAVQVLEELELLRPADVSVFKDLGTVNARLGRIEAAIRYYRWGLEIDANDAVLHQDLGFELLKIKQFKDAEAELLNAIKLDPGLRAAHHHLGDLYAVTGRRGEAVRVYEDCVEDAHPDFEELATDYHRLGALRMKLNEFERGKELLEQALVLDPNRAEIYCDLGQDQLRSNRDERAVEHLEKGLKISQDQPCLYSLLGLALMNLNRLDEAESALQHLVELYPSAPPAYMQLAQVQIRKEDWSKAKATLKKASELAPRDYRVRMSVAELHWRMDEPSEAEALMREALKVQPNDPMLLNNLGYFLLEQNKNLPEALAMIEKAVKASPENAAFLDSLGWVYFKLGKLDLAEKYVRESLNLRPKAAEVVEHLGDIQLRLGKVAEATQSWQDALLISYERAQKERLKQKLDKEKD
jgi:tetratricopeptide (TPR) repeat protein